MKVFMNYAQQLDLAIQEFGKCQKAHRESGAMDSEPIYIFSDLLKTTLEQGRDVRVSRCPDYWQLYTNSKDCYFAGEALGDAAQKCVDIILDCPTRHRAEVEDVVGRYVW